MKEAIELVEGIEAVGIKAVQLGADGVQLTDGLALLSDAGVRAKALTGIQGVGAIAQEFKAGDGAAKRAFIERFVKAGLNIWEEIEKAGAKQN